MTTIDQIVKKYLFKNNPDGLIPAITFGIYQIEEHDPQRR